MNQELALLAPLGAALAIGLLIGVERGWGQRDAAEGQRIAGVRTYGLIGLLGGASATLAHKSHYLLVGVMFLGVAAVLTVAWREALQRDGDLGITSLVSSLLTFVFGAMAASGMQVTAATGAVVVMLLLAYKPQLHRGLQRLDWKELQATAQLLLLTVVVLPLVPDRRFGPWSAINPFEIWWMVVLMASLSYAGHFAMRAAGGRRGVLFTGLFGGLASSTAATLHFARLHAGETNAPGTPLTVTGIVLANLLMMPRMLLLASLISPPVAQRALAPAAAMFLPLALAALLRLRSRHGATDGSLHTPNPLSMGKALMWGLLLAAVLVAGHGLTQAFGEASLLALAGVSGLASIDAIALSLGRLASDGIGTEAAALGLIIAASVNQAAKTLAALAIGGSALGLRVAVPLLLSAIAGLLAAWPLWVALR